MDLIAHIADVVLMVGLLLETEENACLEVLSLAQVDVLIAQDVILIAPTTVATDDQMINNDEN